MPLNTTERAAAARHPTLGAPATRAGTGLGVGENPRRPESPAGLATSKHVPDSHHLTPCLSGLSCSQVASTALCSPRRREDEPKHGNKGRTGNRPGLCLDAVLSARLHSGNRQTDPVGAGPPWECHTHAQCSHSEFTLSDPCDATPVSSGAPGLSRSTAPAKAPPLLTPVSRCQVCACHVPAQSQAGQT